MTNMYSVEMWQGGRVAAVKYCSCNDIKSVRDAINFAKYVYWKCGGKCTHFDIKRVRKDNAVNMFYNIEYNAQKGAKEHTQRVVSFLLS